MPINLKKAKKAIGNYRIAHTALNYNWMPNGDLSLAHNPLTDIMRAELDKNGFNHEDDVFDYSDNEVLSAM